MKLAMVTDKSEAAKVTVEGECPGMGNSWIQMNPIAYGQDWVLSAVADVRAANNKFVAGQEGAYAAPQWCFAAVSTAGAKTTCEFASASAHKYAAALYCETIEGWFFASSKVVNVTAPDNGGKPVGLTLTYAKAISDITNNDVVLNICKGLAEALAVPYSRVTDAYGGFFGSPSPSLPAAPAAAATTKTTDTAAKTTTATTTDKATTKTRVLATDKATTTATTNATAPAKQTAWKLNLFVQPDPFAKTADNKATSTAVTGTAALAAINKVTSTAYGTMTAAAAVVTEAAVKWVKKPVATGGAKQITIAGSTDVGGYVYCAVAKTSTRRMLATDTATTTAATKNTTNTTTTAAKTVAKPAEPVNLQSASTAAKYNIQRFETKTGTLAFSLVFSGLGEGKTYGWMCEATSLSPASPAFRTAMEKGSAKTSPAPVVEEKGDSALWSSLFAAVLMIAAVFFY